MAGRTAVRSAGRKDRRELSPLEVEVINFFVQAIAPFGLPRSLGEIYGLLFISGRPLTMEEIRGRLGLSLGGVSQGLRQLRDYGAVRMVYMPQDRKNHYSAETELRRVVASFLREHIHPQLDRLAAQLDALEANPAARATALHRERLGKLRQWQKISRDTLPLLGELLGGLSDGEDA
jgi:DNA-binding transcriptional regulator GbsR (MarR family)